MIRSTTFRLLLLTALILIIHSLSYAQQIKWIEYDTGAGFQTALVVGGEQSIETNTYKVTWQDSTNIHSICADIMNPEFGPNVIGISYLSGKTLSKKRLHTIVEYGLRGNFSKEAILPAFQFSITEQYAICKYIGFQIDFSFNTLLFISYTEIHYGIVIGRLR